MKNPKHIFECLETIEFFDADPGSGSGIGSGMNNPDHISDSLEIIFICVKILKFFDADPGSEMEKIRIRDPG